MPLTNKITDLGPNLRASCRRSCRRWDHPRGFPVTSGSTSGQWINSWINQIHQWDDDSPLVIPTSIMRKFHSTHAHFFKGTFTTSSWNSRQIWWRNTSQNGPFFGAKLQAIWGIAPLLHEMGPLLRAVWRRRWNRNGRMFFSRHGFLASPKKP